MEMPPTMMIPLLPGRVLLDRGECCLASLHDIVRKGDIAERRSGSLSRGQSIGDECLHGGSLGGIGILFLHKQPSEGRDGVVVGPSGIENKGTEIAGKMDGCQRGGSALIVGVMKLPACSEAKPW